METPVACDGRTSNLEIITSIRKQRRVVTDYD